MEEISFFTNDNKILAWTFTNIAVAIGAVYIIWYIYKKFSNK